MLTKQELLVAAEAARRFPSGYGYSFFSDQENDDDTTFLDAVQRLKDEPGSASLG